MLNDRQLRLVEEYLVDLNPAKTAQRMGAPYAWVKDQLQSSEIYVEVEKAMLARSRRVAITQDQVLQAILDIQEDAMQKELSKRKDSEDNFLETMVDRQSALKSAELLGKHLAMFTDKVNVGGDSSNPLSLSVEFVNRATVVGQPYITENEYSDTV
jgi:hypothetical protein